MNDWLLGSLLLGLRRDMLLLRGRHVGLDIGGLGL